MTRDPEETLNFKLRREQFNHRIPKPFTDMLNDLGNDKRYLLEYLLWIAFKTMNLGLDKLPPFEVQMLEKYMVEVKKVLKESPKLKDDIASLYKVEEELDSREGEQVKRRAKDHASRGSGT
jgi:hypothetical protein